MEVLVAGMSAPGEDLDRVMEAATTMAVALSIGERVRTSRPAHAKVPPPPP